MQPRRLLGLVSAAALVVPLALSAATPASAQRAPQPSDRGIPTLHSRGIKSVASQRFLTHARHGSSALTALDGRLHAVAARNKVSTARLTRILKSDPTAWISTEGRLFYVDQASGDLAAKSGGRPVAADIAPPPAPLSDTFTLHSDPTSTHTIYLDFDGYTLPSGVAWDANGFTPGTYKGFSIDSDYTTFSDTEKAYIQDTWRIVAEKYAAFDVDVTTAPTPASAYNVNFAGDTTYGDHVVFTNDPGAKPASACPAGCIGIAFVGGFNDPSDNNDDAEPAWIYTSTITDSPSYAANVAAHEIGHTLGLEHDGTNTQGANSYYAGHGNWFPLMGASINAVGQFSKGEYADANEFQDDLAVIAATGAPERPDDWGNVASPSSLGQSNSYSQDGIIGDASDKDVFTIDRTCVADLHATATGIGEGQAVDLKLSILNAAGDTTLASNDPVSGQDTSTFPYTPTGLDADVTLPAASAPAGTYRIQVEGVGSGSPLTDGYSNYASIGQYHLSVSGCNGSSGATPAAPTTPSVGLTARSTSAALTWSAPGSVGDGPITGYRITGTPQGTVQVSSPNVTLTGLVPGTTYTANVAALNQYGAGPALAVPVRVQTWVPTAAPSMTLTVVKNQLYLSYFTPANPGHAAFDTWDVTIGGQNFNDAYGAFTGEHITGFGNGTYTVSLALEATADLGTTTPTSTRSFIVGVTAPRIGRAVTGAKRKPITAAIHWSAPLSGGGYAVTGYRAIAYKLDSHGRIVHSYATPLLSSGARSFSGTLPAGRYKFRVVAYDSLGSGPISGYSNIVTAR